VYELFAQSKERKVDFIPLRAAGMFLILSSIGPYLLGIVMAKNLNDNIWYELSVYWFLHFLFNGFFFLVFLSLILSEIKKITSISAHKEKWFLYLMIGSIIPLYASFAIDSIQSVWVYILTFIGSAGQLIGVLFFYREIISLVNSSKGFIQKSVIRIVLLSFFLKLVFQFLSSFPFMKDFIFNAKPTFIIGYLHLVMLGMFSLFFTWLLKRLAYVHNTNRYTIGIILFIIGIVLSEVLLFTQGFMLHTWQTSVPNYYLLLYTTSALMPLGILFLIINQYSKNKN
jgi:hypothetical protein